MPTRPLDQLTLREKIRDCAHRTRELVEHLEQNLAKNLRELYSKTRSPKSGQEDDLTDVGVRTLVAGVLDSHRYGREHFEDEIEAYGQAINAELKRIMKPLA